MSWQEKSVSDQRQAFVLLASLEGANVSTLCQRFGISRQTGHLWLRRHRAGETGFEDRSRRPHASPMRTSAELEASILGIRDRHPAWGARKIVFVLKEMGLVPPAVSTIHAVLDRHGRIAPGAVAHGGYGSFEHDRPNALWQMDFKGKVRLHSGIWCHPLVILDDHSRYALEVSAHANEQARTVQNRLIAVFRHHGLPDAIYVDNGSPWGGGVPGQWTGLAVWLLKLGIKTIHGTPYHPQGRGKIERFNRSLAAEVFALNLLHDLVDTQAAFDRWRPVYNHQRPHQGLGFAYPASRYRPSARPYPETIPKPEYDAQDRVRRVGTTKTYISFKGRLHKLPQAFAGETVAVRPNGPDGHYSVCYGAHEIAKIDLTCSLQQRPEL
jgi:transposase InsO family protein